MSTTWVEEREGEKGRTALGGAEEQARADDAAL